MPGKKGHKLNVQLMEEEYGWLVRYAEKTDQSMSNIMRKALRLYITVIAKKQKEKANEATKGDLFLTSDEVVTGTGVQAN